MLFRLGKSEMARKDQECATCGNSATLLCDFVLGFEIKGWKLCTGQAALNANRFEDFVPGKGLPYTGSGSEMYTCDAPICDQCATYIGPIFFDGDKTHTAIESVDVCPLHGGHQFYRSPIITAEQAERIRRQTWKKPKLLLVRN